MSLHGVLNAHHDQVAALPPRKQPGRAPTSGAVGIAVMTVFTNVIIIGIIVSIMTARGIVMCGQQGRQPGGRNIAFGIVIIRISCPASS